MNQKYNKIKRGLPRRKKALRMSYPLKIRLFLVIGIFISLYLLSILSSSSQESTSLGKTEKEDFFSQTGTMFSGLGKELVDFFGENTLTGADTVTLGDTYTCGYVNADTTLGNNIIGGGGNCFIINASDVTLDCQGYSISNSSTAVYGSGNYNNITLKNCNLILDGSEVQYGFSLDGVNNLTIFNNSIRNLAITAGGKSFKGIFVPSYNRSQFVINISGNTISNLTCSDNCNNSILGVEIATDVSTQAGTIVLENNNCYNLSGQNLSQATGMYIHYHFNDSSIKGINITNNRLENITCSGNSLGCLQSGGGMGIYLSGINSSVPAQIKRNNLTNMGVAVNALSSNLIFSENNFLNVAEGLDLGATFGPMGLFTSVSGVIVSGNNFTNIGSIGLRIAANSSNNSLINNTIMAATAILDSTSTSLLNFLTYSNGFGLINWSKGNLTSRINFTLGDSIILANNSVGLIDHQFASNLNSSAVIELRGFGYGSTPQLLKNGVRCDNDPTLCNISSYSGGILSAQVSYFSNYTTRSDIYPYWSGNRTAIVSTYSSTSTSVFNISWMDDYSVSKVWLQSNYSGADVNYSMALSTGGNTTNGNYTYSALLPAGSYSWLSHANDTSGQWNSTITWNFTIARASSAVNLTLNDSNANRSLSYGAILTLNCTRTQGEGFVYLYRNGTLINSGASSLSNASLFSTFGLFNITCTYEATQNYTRNYSSYWVDVTDTTFPYFDPLPVNITIELGTALNYDINATDNLAIDGYKINNSNFSINLSGFLINATYLSVGNYSMNITVNDTSGNSNSTAFYVYVRDTTPPSFTYLANQEITYGSALGVQFSAADFSNISAWSINDSIWFAINSTGYLRNTSLLNVTTYNLNVSVNDTYNNINSSLVSIIVATASSSSSSSSSSSGGGGGGSHWECYTDLDCTDGKVCQEHRCTTPTAPTTIKCSADFDCGGKEILKQRYCEGNKIYQRIASHTCGLPGTINSSCRIEILEELLETCPGECAEGKCLAVHTAAANVSLKTEENFSAAMPETKAALPATGKAFFQKVGGTMIDYSSYLWILLVTLLSAGAVVKIVPVVQKRRRKIIAAPLPKLAPESLERIKPPAIWEQGEKLTLQEEFEAVQAEINKMKCTEKSENIPKRVELPQQSSAVIKLPKKEPQKLPSYLGISRKEKVRRTELPSSETLIWEKAKIERELAEINKAKK